MFLLGLVLLLLAPRAADAVARTAKAKALVSFAVGFLSLIPIAGAFIGLLAVTTQDAGQWACVAEIRRRRSGWAPG